MFMTKREIGFALIGLGTGLMLAVAAILEFVVSYGHHMFIVGIQWRSISVFFASPCVLVVAGSSLLRRDRSRV
jgi:hypothetical protein